MKKNKGITFIEVMLAVAILLFFILKQGKQVVLLEDSTKNQTD
jgi:hypothetical protein